MESSVPTSSSLSVDIPKTKSSVGETRSWDSEHLDDALEFPRNSEKLDEENDIKSLTNLVELGDRDRRPSEEIDLRKPADSKEITGEGNDYERSDVSTLSDDCFDQTDKNKADEKLLQVADDLNLAGMENTFPGNISAEVINGNFYEDKDDLDPSNSSEGKAQVQEVQTADDPERTESVQKTDSVIGVPIQDSEHEPLVAKSAEPDEAADQKSVEYTASGSENVDEEDFAKSWPKTESLTIDTESDNYKFESREGEAKQFNANSGISIEFSPESESETSSFHLDPGQAVDYIKQTQESTQFVVLEPVSTPVSDSLLALRNNEDLNPDSNEHASLIIPGSDSSSILRNGKDLIAESAEDAKFISTDTDESSNQLTTSIVGSSLDKALGEPFHAGEAGDTGAVREKNLESELMNTEAVGENSESEVEDQDVYFTEEQGEEPKEIAEIDCGLTADKREDFPSSPEKLPQVGFEVDHSDIQETEDNQKKISDAVEYDQAIVVDEEDSSPAVEGQDVCSAEEQGEEPKEIAEIDRGLTADKREDFPLPQVGFGVDHSDIEETEDNLKKISDAIEYEQARVVDEEDSSPAVEGQDVCSAEEQGEEPKEITETDHGLTADKREDFPLPQVGFEVDHSDIQETEDNQKKISDAVEYDQASVVDEEDSSPAVEGQDVCSAEEQGEEPKEIAEIDRGLTADKREDFPLPQVGFGVDHSDIEETEDNLKKISDAIEYEQARVVDEVDSSPAVEGQDVCSAEEQGEEPKEITETDHGLTADKREDFHLPQVGFEVDHSDIQETEDNLKKISDAIEYDQARVVDEEDSPPAVEGQDVCSAEEQGEEPKEVTETDHGITADKREDFPLPQVGFEVDRSDIQETEDNLKKISDVIEYDQASVVDEEDSSPAVEGQDVCSAEEQGEEPREIAEIDCGLTADKREDFLSSPEKLPQVGFEVDHSDIQEMEDNLNKISAAIEYDQASLVDEGDSSPAVEGQDVCSAEEQGEEPKETAEIDRGLTTDKREDIHLPQAGFEVDHSDIQETEDNLKKISDPIEYGQASVVDEEDSSPAVEGQDVCSTEEQGEEPKKIAEIDRGLTADKREDFPFSPEKLHQEGFEVDHPDTLEMEDNLKKSSDALEYDQASVVDEEDSSPAVESGAKNNGDDSKIAEPEPLIVSAGDKTYTDTSIFEKNERSVVAASSNRDQQSESEIQESRDQNRKDSENSRGTFLQRIWPCCGILEWMRSRRD